MGTDSSSFATPICGSKGAVIRFWSVTCSRGELYERLLACVGPPHEIGTEVVRRFLIVLLWVANC